MRAILPSVKKAFEINSDPSTYGTFAEIGAGQEVARHFFVAGHASGTIAKAISAYDTIFSDEIYGREKSGRYVCESRVKKMLDHEYSLLSNRLSKSKKSKRFFAFADTVATNRKHGWMAVRFQLQPDGEPNQVILHVNMLDNTRLQQTEALGHLGVNLIYACFYKSEDPKNFITSLTENLSAGQIDIDMIRFEGTQFKDLDNRLMCLELIEQKITRTVMFNAEGGVVQPGDMIYTQPLFVQRGAFRPVTNVNLQISEAGVDQFNQDFEMEKKPVSMYEITMAQLDLESNDRSDFLNRVDCLAKLGIPVLITDFVHYYELKEYFRSFTHEAIGMVIGGNQLDYFFEESKHAKLDGGLFENAAKLFDLKTCVYVYPYKTDLSCTTLRSFFPPEKITDLYSYLIKNNKLKDLSDCDEVNVSQLASEVRTMLKENDPAWEKLVPEKVVDHINNNNLFR